MDGFKNTTKMKYMGAGGMVDGYSMGGYAKGGNAKPMMKGGDAKPMMAKGGNAKAGAKISKVMGEFKKGDLHSGSKDGPKVKSPKQAMAIALSEAGKGKGKMPMKKGGGGDVKVGKMPPLGESVKSGNRMSKMTAAEMRAMEERFGNKRRPSPGDSVKSGNRIAKEEADEARAMGVFNKGGKVRKYAEGGTVKPMGQTTAAYGAKLRDQIKAGKMTVAQAQAAQNAFVKEQMAARTAADAKATMAKPMGQVTAAYGANLREQVKAGKMTNAQAQAAQNAFVKQQMSPANAATLQSTLAKAARSQVSTAGMTPEQFLKFQYEQERAIHSNPSSPFHHMYFPQTQPPVPKQPPMLARPTPVGRPEMPEMPVDIQVQPLVQLPSPVLERPPMPMMPERTTRPDPNVIQPLIVTENGHVPNPAYTADVAMQRYRTQLPTNNYYSPQERQQIMSSIENAYAQPGATGQQVGKAYQNASAAATQARTTVRAPSTQPSMPTTLMAQPPAIDPFVPVTSPRPMPGFRVGGMAKRGGY